MNATSVAVAMIFSSTVIFAQENKSDLAAGNKPFVLGTIVELQSKVLAEKRILNIWLPEGYKQGDTAKYPVIYLLDGSADEDFIHIVGLVQFNNFEWINQVPKSIVVGIAITDRKRDFTFPTTIDDEKKNYPSTGHSDKFISFIEKELQPFIESTYRTCKVRTIIGQSLGGLLATEILLSRPSLFNKYIIISPSLWWDNGSLLHQNAAMAKDAFNQPTDIYIGVGKEGITPGASASVMEVDAKSLAEKIKAINNKGIHVYFDYLPQENHATIMHQAVFNAFRLIYK